MKNEKLSRLGFTLIELLVVVLIIGILASVALPQYNKAVRKARLSEVATTFNSISKGIDMWLLENDGYPAFSTTLSGNRTGSGYAKLDTQQSCTKEDSFNCYTKVGAWEYDCSGLAGDNLCRIVLNTRYNPDGTTGNTWLNEEYLLFVKNGNGPWTLDTQYGAPSREICLWWKDLYGNERVTTAYGETHDSACDAY